MSNVTDQTTAPKLRDLWKCSRPDGYGCHAPGKEKGREPAKRTPGTEGSKTQKRKAGRSKHTPFKG